MTASTQTAVARPPFDPVTISPLRFWDQTSEEREVSFKVLRDERPISWHPPIEGSVVPPDIDGVWAVTRAEDIAYVSKHPELFSSSEGVLIEAIPEDVNQAAMSFLAMDGSQHATTRRLISSVFTPRQVAKIKDQIDGQAARIVDGLLENRSGDFVEEATRLLPMWTIFEMVGVPEELHEETILHANGMLSWNDADVAAGRDPGQVMTDSLVGLLTIGLDLAEQRRAKPTSDLTSLLAQAEIDGRQLTDEEIAAFFVLLAVAGTDTTRNTMTFAALALQEFPEQRALLQQDFDGHVKLAMEEFVRWATPVMTFRRTATQDTELHGQHIREGDWLLMVYSSGNRDERAFDDPGVFDITRKPNPHVGFGGGGPHFCMGHFLAKMQLEAFFRELTFRTPTLQLGQPDYLTSNFFRVAKSLPYTLDQEHP